MVGLHVRQVHERATEPTDALVDVVEHKSGQWVKRVSQLDLHGQSIDRRTSVRNGEKQINDLARNRPIQTT